MRPKTFIKLLFSVCFMLTGITQVFAANASTPTVEFPSVIHFLDSSGDDIEVGPGSYQVEAAESWLKLVPEGESRSTAVLLEAVQGTHQEDVTEPMVRTFSNPDAPDVLHVALLMPDGVGMEAVGTVGHRNSATCLEFRLCGQDPQSQDLFSPSKDYPSRTCWPNASADPTA